MKNEKPTPFANLTAVKFGDDFALLADGPLNGVLVSRDELAEMTACALPLKEAFRLAVTSQREVLEGYGHDGVEEYVSFPTIPIKRVDFDAFDALSGDVEIDIVHATILDDDGSFEIWQ